MASTVSHWSSSSSFLNLNFTNDSSLSFSASLSFSRLQFPNSASQKRNSNENYRGYTVKCALAKTKMPPSPASDAYIREPHKYFDEVVITVRAGDGGHGAILSMPNHKTPSKSQGKFDRDKTKKKASYKRDFDGSIILPMGGHGGDVVIYADESKDSLLEFHNKSKHKAKRGGNVDSMGVLTSHLQNGLAAPTLRISVPLGTVVKLKKGKFLADLANPGDEVLVARGGQGGVSLLDVPEYKRKRMTTLTTNIMRDDTDKVLSFGQSGEEVSLQLILRVVADVGLVGLPNAGKSTLLAAITHAKPDIADYPFTTLMPNLGRLDGDPSLGADKYSSEATLADLPGLIEGAHLGKGLGRNFLRHLRRTRLLVHVVDAAAGDPVGDYRTVKEELRMYNPEYLDRPYLVVLNKIDKPEAIEGLPAFTEEIWKIGCERTSPKRDTSSVDESQNSEISSGLSAKDQKVKELEEYPRPLAVVGVSVLSMRVALLGRNKLGLVDGSCKKETFPESVWNQWERVNAVVLSWLMNSVAKGLLGGIMYASNAQMVWDELFERFNKIDGSRTFNLHKEIATLIQGTSTVSTYFSKLKNLWEEFEALVPVPCCNCEKSKDFVLHLQKLKLFQFLMGLNESYNQARSQILLMSPMPSINQAYGMVISDEGQKSIAANSGILGANPAANGSNNPDMAFYARGGPSKFKKNYNVMCEFCKIKGHTKEVCYKLVGYPTDYNRFKKRGVNGYNPSVSAHNVTSGDSDQSNVKANACNVMTEESRPGLKHNVGFENKQAEVGFYPFTKEQYNQILSLLKNGGNATALTANCADLTGKGLKSMRC